MQNKKGSNPLIKWITGAVIGLVIALVICIARGLFTETDTAQIYRILCDAFFVPGVLFTCFGLLSLISNDGFFDGVAYSFNRMRHVFVNGNSASAYAEDKQKTYYDYKQAKNKKRGKRKYHMLVIGLCFIAAAVVFLQLFASV